MKYAFKAFKIKQQGIKNPAMITGLYYF